MRTVFVRDGFSFWAMVFPVIWLLFQRMWLVLIAFLLVCVGVIYGAQVFGERFGLIAALAITILFAFEARALKRWTLARHGWKLAAVVQARRLADAEYRYFEALRGRPAASRTPRSTVVYPASGAAVASTGRPAAPAYVEPAHVAPWGVPAPATPRSSASGSAFAETRQPEPARDPEAGREQTATEGVAAYDSETEAQQETDAAEVRENDDAATGEDTNPRRNRGFLPLIGKRR